MSKYYKVEDVEMLVAFSGICDGTTYVELENALQSLPTIEIVYCEECKYREKCEQIVVFDIGENQIEGRKIDYCSYGERIDNE